MFCNHFFNFTWVNVEARYQDHVFLTVYDLEVTACVHDTDIASTEEAIFRHDFFSFIRTVPVAFHDLRTTNRNFTLFTLSNFITIIIKQYHIGQRQWNTNCATELSCCWWVCSCNWWSLRQTITFNDDGTRHFFPRFSSRWQYRHTTTHCHLQFAMVKLFEFFVIHQSIEQCVYCREEWRLVFT